MSGLKQRVLDRVAKEVLGKVDWKIYVEGCSNVSKQYVKDVECAVDLALEEVERAIEGAKVKPSDKFVWIEKLKKRLSLAAKKEEAGKNA